MKLPKWVFHCLEKAVGGGLASHLTPASGPEALHGSKDPDPADLIPAPGEEPRSSFTFHSHLRDLRSLALTRPARAPFRKRIRGDGACSSDRPTRRTGRTTAHATARAA